MSVSLEPGAVIAGRYRLDRLLGRGGMGQVWAVTHEVTLHTAALKLLNGPVDLRPDRRRRFLREARAAAAVQHPNVVRIHDFFELGDGTPVLLMDLLEGETLGQRLSREQSLSLGDTADVLLPVVSAVGTAHSLGIVHRDLKPDNVFLARSPRGGLDVRVLDFGIAKLSGIGDAEDDPGASTETGTLLGTPYYMAPEQCFGDGVDHRADEWAIGVMLYETLTGVRPIDGENRGRVLSRLMSEAVTPIQVLAPDLPGEVVALVASLLARDPAARPDDLRAVHDVLAPFASVTVPPFGAAARERPPELDSNPSSGRSAQRPLSSGRENSDPGPRTVESIRPGRQVVPSVDSRHSVALPATTVTRPRKLWIGVAAALLIAVVIARHAGHAPDGNAPPADGRMPPLVSRPAPAAPISRPAPGPLASAQPELPPQTTRTGSSESASRGDSRTRDRHKPAPRTSASGAPAPTTGLVEEPPF